MMGRKRWADLDDDEVLGRFADEGSGSVEGDRMLSSMLKVLTGPYLERISERAGCCGKDSTLWSDFSTDMTDRHARRMFADRYAHACSIIICRCSMEPLVSYNDLTARMDNPALVSGVYGNGWRVRESSGPDCVAPFIRFAHDRPGDAAALSAPFMHAVRVVGGEEMYDFKDFNTGDEEEDFGTGNETMVNGFIASHTFAPMAAAIMDDPDIPMSDLVLTMALGAIPGQDCGYGGYAYNGPAVSIDMLDAVICTAPYITEAEIRHCMEISGSAHLEPAILMEDGECVERVWRVLRLLPSWTATVRKHISSLPPLDSGFMREAVDAEKHGSVSQTDGGIKADWRRKRMSIMESMLAWAERCSLPMDSLSVSAASLVPSDEPPSIRPMRTMLIAACMDDGSDVNLIFHNAFPFIDDGLKQWEMGAGALYMMMYTGLCSKGSRESKAERARMAADAEIIQAIISERLSDVLGLKNNGVMDISMDDFLTMLDGLESGEPLDFVVETAAAHMMKEDVTKGD